MKVRIKRDRAAMQRKPHQIPIRTCMLCFTLCRQEQPAHANAQDSWALVWAAIRGHASILRLLLNQAQHPAQADAGDSRTLVWAAKKGHTECCTVLLDQERPFPAQVNSYGGLVFSRLTYMYINIDQVQ